MASAGISKIDAARRQLDTAIDLWFEDRDGLAIFTLAYASFKVLMDVYPHQQSDGFSETLDEVIGQTGWRSMSGTANFLKHADRDPNAVLARFSPDQSMPVIGLATILYGRVAPELSLKMKAFDSWIESTASDELGIPELDANVERAAANKRVRDALKAAPREAYFRFASDYYRSFLRDYERLNAEVEQALSEGRSFQAVMDLKFEELAARAKNLSAQDSS